MPLCPRSHDSTKVSIREQGGHWRPVLHSTVPVRVAEPSRRHPRGPPTCVRGSPQPCRVWLFLLSLPLGFVKVYFCFLLSGDLYISNLNFFFQWRTEPRQLYPAFCILSWTSPDIADPNICLLWSTELNWTQLEKTKEDKSNVTSDKLNE